MRLTPATTHWRPRFLPATLGSWCSCGRFRPAGRSQRQSSSKTELRFVNSADGYLYAIRAGTGAQVWRFRTFTDGQVQDGPIVSGAHVFVGCLVDGNAQQNGICALRISNGTLAWSDFLNCSCTPTAGLAAAPVVLGGTLLVPYYQSNAGGRSVLQVVNGDTGKPQWHYAYPAGNGGGPSPAAPAIANGAVYVGEQYSRSVCSVNLSSKAEDWCLPTGDDYNSLAVYKNVVYVNTYSHGVFAFNASNASQIWHTCRTPATTRVQTIRPRLPTGSYTSRASVSKGISTLSTLRPDR